MRTRTSSVRPGVVLLVVISLLMLFAIVGIAFVIYAEAQASSARIRKESEGQRRPDMDPEELFAYFMSQLIYDTDNPNSALRNESLGRNMYGQPGSTMAYQEVAHTYPDEKNMFLAAQRANDGAILIPSFVRAGKSLRAPGLPPLADPFDGDVKNLADSPGCLRPGGGGQFSPRDSIWLDAGHPVMVAVDGRRFKPLFAVLILDQDGKLNLNAHGNTLGNIGGGYYSVSHQGWCPGEVCIEKVLTGPNQEAGNIFMGNTTTGALGRYDQAMWKSFWGGGGWGGRSTEELKGIYSPGGHFYASTNLDCWPPSSKVEFELPKPGSNFAFPFLSGAYSHGWMGRNDNVFHPNLFNVFDPRQNVYWFGSPPAEKLNNRSFPITSMEALLRYGDTGSPALASDLFFLCPQSFQSGKTRRLVTTHGFDPCRPGLIAGDPGQYTLAAAAAYPTGQAGAQQNRLPRIDLNRGFLDYPLTDKFDPAGYRQAHQERVDMARELFEALRQVTGAGDPATAAPGTPEHDALRWLAQLAVNIVDFVQFPQARTAGTNSAPPDDIMTCFNWNPNARGDVRNGWVFGTVLPRLVVNETYIEVSNTEVNVWVELHNTFAGDTGGNATPNGQRAIPVPLDGVARLYVPDQDYAAYRLIVAQHDTGMQNNLREMGKHDNVLGQPVNIKTVVDKFDADDPAKLKLNGDDLNQVKPNFDKVGDGTNGKIQDGAPGENKGYYVLGPKTAFPGTDSDPKFFATLAVKEQDSKTEPGKKSSMSYSYNAKSDPPADQLKHTIALQRLACPYLPWQNDPNLENFNPYVTVDYVAEAPANDSKTGVDQRFSVGRKQPYAADKDQQVQQPAAMAGGQPKHTLFAVNNSGGAPAAFDWLVHMNRPLISPIELLDVSGFKPHQLTQKFIHADPAGQTRKFGQRAPWLQQDALIYRTLEYVEAGMRPQYTPIGGRFAGRININSIWDRETFEALCDQRDINYFTSQAVTALYDAMVASRSPGWNGKPQPGNNDRPFLPFTAANIDDTILRSDVNPPANHPLKRLLEPKPDSAAGELRAEANDHPYLRLELLNKICGNLTTRSNVFAVWLTVGFFEVDSSNQLGEEVGLREGRNIRHRMFSLVDRTALTLDKDQPGQPGPRPYFISAAAAAQAGQNVITVPTLSGLYEELSWSIKAGMDLVIDSGPKQETVRVQSVDSVRLEITTAAPLQNNHPAGFAISNATLGYPGPQPRFDPRNPKYAGVIRYFSIVE